MKKTKEIFNTSKKMDVYMVLTAVYCVALVVSNIISNRTFEIAGFMLPSAVIVFPVVYIINDVLTECFGFKMAKKTIWMAFFLNLMSVIFFNIAINLPTSTDFTSYNIVLGNTLKPLIASLIAYLIGSFVNAKIMDYLKTRSGLMVRCIASTLFGESIDAMIFISIMFLGILNPAIVLQMIITQALVKTVYEIILYPVTKYVISRINLIVVD